MHPEVHYQMIKEWLPYVAGTFNLPVEQSGRRDLLNNFWTEFYYKAFNISKEKKKINQTKTNKEILKDQLESELNANPKLFDSDTRTISIKKKYFVRTYREDVYELIKNNPYREDPLPLRKLQLLIESRVEGLSLNGEENAKERPFKATMHM